MKVATVSSSDWTRAASTARSAVSASIVRWAHHAPPPPPTRRVDRARGREGPPPPPPRRKRAREPPPLEIGARVARRRQHSQPVRHSTQSFRCLRLSVNL